MKPTYNNLLNHYIKNLTGDPLNSALIRQDKQPAWLPFLYWLSKNRDNINNQPATKTYDNYFYWADDSGFEILKRNGFTRLMNENHYFYKHKLVNDKLTKFYDKLDYCPCCLRTYPQ